MIYMTSNNFSGSFLCRRAAPSGSGSEHERTRASRKTNYNGDIYKITPKNVVTFIRSFRCVNINDKFSGFVEQRQKLRG